MASAGHYGTSTDAGISCLHNPLNSTLAAPAPPSAGRPTVVLVLDAAQRSALAATRSLGRHGYRVVTADSNAVTLAGASRYSDLALVYPDPYTEPLAFIDWMAQCLTRETIDIVLPMTEVTTDLMLRHNTRWPQVLLPFAGIDTIDALANKVALHQRAERLGVPIPPTRYYDNAAELLSRAPALQFPLVLKPWRSRIWRDDHWLSTGVVIVHSQDELNAALTTEQFAQQAFMVQGFIEGEGQGVFALYDHGRPVAFFAHRRLRERPPWGGVSVLSESARPDARLQQLAQTLLDDAQWHGVAMVEFKVAPDGTPYLMEINTRFWGSLQLAIDAGVDFPTLLLDVAQQRAVTPPSLREGVRLRWLLGDIDHLYLTWKSPRYTLAQKLRTTLALLTPDLGGRTRHEINRYGDAKPAWIELKRYFGFR